MSTRTLAPWLLVLTACGGSSGASNDAGLDAASPLDASLPNAQDAGDAGIEDGGADAPVETTDAADGATSLGDAATTCVSNPDVPSSQTVNLVVTNTTTSDRYLVTAGSWCDPLSIAVSQAPLPLTLGFQCTCECPNPGPAQPAGLRRLAPGESFTLTWDARSLTTCSTSIDCATRGWPQLGTAHELAGTKSPVAAGAYSASISALTAVPDGCGGDGTTFSCPMSPALGSPASGYPPAIQTLCKGDVGGSSAFTLPASGDVSVPLTITK